MTSKKDEWLSSHNTPEEADQVMFELAASLLERNLTTQFGVHRKTIPNTYPTAYGVYLSKY